VQGLRDLTERLHEKERQMETNESHVLIQLQQLAQAFEQSQAECLGWRSREQQHNQREAEYKAMQLQVRA